MRYFRRIELDWLTDSNAELLAEIGSNEGVWLADQSRQKRIGVQRHTQTIFLRGPKRTPGSDEVTEQIHPSTETKYAASFPRVMAALYKVADQVSGELSRSQLVRLAPQSVVYPHIDRGSYYVPRDRYHYVLSSPLGSPMKAGDEEVTMRQGELWWFDNKAMHDASNMSSEWRMHAIFDVLPKSREGSTGSRS